MARFSSPVMHETTTPVFDFRRNIHLMPTNDEEDHNSHIQLDFLVQTVAYAAFLAILVMIVALIVKLLVNLVNGDGDGGSGVDQASYSETNSLLTKEATSFSYGTCDYQEDEECGESHCSSSSDDLYDGKICVICFDDNRSCFFIPCGHCVACHSCAKRIIGGENKTCPICRKLIQEVSKLFVS